MIAEYYITNDLRVDRRFERTLAIGGGTGDAALYLMAAPEIGSTRPSAIIYLATNGDPVYVGALGSDGWHHLAEESTDEEDGGRPVWEYALQAMGWTGEGEAEAAEFVYDVWADSAQ